MRMHILGICGTFMAGIAVLAKELGLCVSGTDENVYPPMSTQLQQQGIELHQGYASFAKLPRPDLVVVGNVISRGNPAMEIILNEKIPYISGPQWLLENVLKQRKVLAVAGTHGKTTTSSILAWLLTHAGLQPGFLIGGIAHNLGVSAKLGTGDYFVLEADEYDTAFFDKRAKFLHYHPDILIINNLEFDHADIYVDLAAIQRQFHYLLRTVPGNGLVVTNADDKNIAAVLLQGCWSRQQQFSLLDAKVAWTVAADDAVKANMMSIYQQQRQFANVTWPLLGQHNRYNALAATAAAHAVGISAAQIRTGLATFQGIKRRLERCAEINGITIYDDFAHHPTAIAATLSAVRQAIGNARLIAVLEFGSHSMAAGVHAEQAIQALSVANIAIVARFRAAEWDLAAVAEQATIPTYVATSADDIVAHVIDLSRQGDHIVMMSNRGLASLQAKLAAALQAAR